MTEDLCVLLSNPDCTCSLCSGHTTHFQRAWSQTRPACLRETPLPPTPPSGGSFHEDRPVRFFMVSAFVFKTRQVGVFSLGNPNALKENNYHWFTLHSSVSSWHHVKSAQEILSLPSKPRAGSRAVCTWQEEDLKGEGSSKGKGAIVSQKGMKGQTASATGTETPACSWPSGLTQLGSASIYADLQPCSLPVLKRDPRGLCALLERPGLHPGSKSLSAAGDYQLSTR